MNKRYTHLTQKERYQIWSEKKAGVSNEIIAQDLGRDLSTVKRELARNTGARGYRPKQTHNFAQERHQQKPKATNSGSNSASSTAVYLDKLMVFI